MAAKFYLDASHNTMFQYENEAGKITEGPRPAKRSDQVKHDKQFGEFVQFNIAAGGRAIVLIEDVPEVKAKAEAKPNPQSFGSKHK